MRKNDNMDIEGLYRLYYRPLCLYALHYVKDPDHVEDIVQECFFSLCGINDRSSGGLESRNISSPRSYLYTMVRNRCLDVLRKDARGGKTVQLDDMGEEIPEEELQDRSFLEARMWTAIDTLPPKCREIFLMCKRDGLSYDEISQQLGISGNTVRNQMSKALRIVKEGAKRLIVYIFF